ncbi:MAG TPA: hypothetical protein VLM40_01145 [Gemmata sp.]|nr:hypothetical protein [Gemmata sp.]
MWMRKRLTASWCAAFLGVIALTATGCSSGEKLNPVKGKVLYKGEPLAGATVSFHPKGANDLKRQPAIGLTQEDGTFTVKTGPDDGAPAGDYVVTIICTAQPKAADGKKKILSFGSEDISVDRLGGAYANMANSKINVTIKDGKNELEPFNLK